MPGRIKRNSWSNGEHVLFEYIRSLDHAKLKKVLEKEGYLADTFSQSGYTPMTCACVEGNEAAVEILIKYSHNINQKDNKGNCPIHYAAGLGKENILKMLLNHEADINARGRDSSTALHCAIQEKRITIVKLLLDVGIEIPLRRSSICMNPFDLAKEVGSQEIFDMIDQALKLRETSNYSHLLRNPPLYRANHGYIESRTHHGSTRDIDDQRRFSYNRKVDEMQRDMESHKEVISRDFQMLQAQVKELDSKVASTQECLIVHDKTLLRIENILEKTVKVVSAKGETNSKSQGYIEPVHSKKGSSINGLAYLEPTPHAVNDHGKVATMVKKCQPCYNNKTLPSSYLIQPTVNEPTKVKQSESKEILRNPDVEDTQTTQLNLGEETEFQDYQQTQVKSVHGEQIDQHRYIKVISKTTQCVRPYSEPCSRSPGCLDSIPPKVAGMEESNQSPRSENHYSIIDDKNPDCLLSQKERDNIQKNFIQFKTQITFDKIKDQLFEAGILKVDDIISWNARSADEQAILVLLEKVYKGPRKYKTSLQNILWEEGLHDVAELLN